MKIAGLIGLIAIAVCWVPQTYETMRAGRVNMKLSFLVLYFTGSVALTLYAIGDPIFVTLNVLTAAGSSVNLYYKIFPRSDGSVSE